MNKEERETYQRANVLYIYIHNLIDEKSPCQEYIKTSEKQILNISLNI